jgi:hypothetical protein
VNDILPLTNFTAKYVKGRVRVVRTVRMLRDTPYSKMDIKDISLEAKEHSLQ